LISLECVACLAKYSYCGSEEEFKVHKSWGLGFYEVKVLF